MIINNLQFDDIIMLALKEDLGMGDITTLSTISEGQNISGKVIAKEHGVICGLEVTKRVFELVDEEILFRALAEDGARVEKGSVIAVVNGPASSILSAERTALNFLQRLSGIATKTASFAELVKDTKTSISDTRKTTPGHRILEKYAVRTGGGVNHRFNLSDGILIKDNHIAAAGGITNAVNRARVLAPHTVKIEVEAETIDMVLEALSVGADIIMLDNMSIDQMKDAVAIIDGRAIVEASGNMGDKDIRQIAQTGVDIISIGALTHSVTSLDISIKFDK